MVVDLFLVYNFLKRLATPFESWAAYKSGVIDKDGNILIPKDKRSSDEKKSFGIFDLMILKLKKIINQVPGNQASKMLASYAAALYLIKEHNMFQDGILLSESIQTEESLDSILTGFSNGYSDYTTSVDLVNHFVEEVITNSAGSGAVAGIGIGPDGEPGLNPKQRKRHKRNAVMTRTEDCGCEEGEEKKVFHKPSKMAKKLQTFRQFEAAIREGNLASDHRDNLRDHGVRRTIKRPKKPKAPIA